MAIRPTTRSRNIPLDQATQTIVHLISYKEIFAALASRAMTVLVCPGIELSRSKVRASLLYQPIYIATSKSPNSI